MPLLLIDYPEIDPIFFHIGPLPIRWYALAYLVGILLTFLNAGWLARNYQIPVSRKHLEDFLFWAVIGVVVGGRLGFVLFYKPGDYLDDPLSIFFLWDGGMSFHGGLAGVVLATVFFCRANHLSLMRFSDLLASGAPIGLLLGRLANFINGELWGRQTDVSWAMIFPNDRLGVPRHPSQLYEAELEGIMLLIICNIAYRIRAVRDRPGSVAGLFFLGYGIARFMVEYVREPDDYFKGFLVNVVTMGQLLSLPMVFIGLGFLLHALRNKGQVKAA